MDLKSVKKYLDLAEEHGKPYMGDVTGALFEAAEMGDIETFRDVLLDVDYPLTVVDRGIILEVLEKSIKRAPGRPTHPALPTALLGLSEILRREFGFEKEQARIARISEITGKSASGIRDLMKKAEFMRLGVWAYVPGEIPPGMRSIVIEDLKRLGFDVGFLETSGN